MNLHGAIIDRNGGTHLRLGDGSGNATKMKNFQLKNVYSILAQGAATTANEISGCKWYTTSAQDFGSQGILGTNNAPTNGKLIFTDNTVYAEMSAGQVLYNVSGWTIERNSFYLGVASHSGTAGLSGTTPTGMKNNIWRSDDDTKINTNLTLSANGTNCCFSNMSATNDSGGTDNLFDTDPLFVDETSPGDLRLRPSSPCINAGTS
jgi:hypothetical protein